MVVETDVSSSVYILGEAEIPEILMQKLRNKS